MYALFAQIARLFPATAPASARLQDEVALQLMERADARFGTNPHQAQELRIAACAYLSVVR